MTVGIPTLYRRYRRGVNLCVLALLTVLALVCAFLLRFEFSLPPQEIAHLKRGLLLALATKVWILLLCGRDRVSWRYVGIYDLRRIVFAQTAASLGFVVLTRLTIGTAFPRSIYILDLLLACVLEAGLRILLRILAETSIREMTGGGRKPVLIYGAGAAGISLLKEIRMNPSLRLGVAGFLDDDPDKRRQMVMGVPVLGSGREAAIKVDALRKRGLPVEEIVIAMPSAKPERLREAVANCRAADVLVKMIPGIGELLNGKVLASQIRKVKVEDLLGREPVHLDNTTIRKSIRGRVVMVTGGGGSIGSELCRQIARYEPACLLVFERAESDLFRIDHELRHAHPGVEIVPLIGDIREQARVDEVLRRYEVHSIFHAAAYKHVPLMEDHVLEASANNVLGTWTLVEAAQRAGVNDFLMISTDKAVNSTNIMGLTKRTAEIIVSSRPVPSASRSFTKFVSVRFGNVLGSNGSVVPLFERQIANGGPVTVTHPEMRRYFMTIPEAAQLVLQASTMGTGAEVFVLDMGQPVRIVDLARNMIRLSGKVPDSEIEIRFTGLRPGEKLFEELNLSDEHLMPTYHEKIRIFRGERRDLQDIRLWIACLSSALASRDQSEVVRLMADLVPEYQPVGQWKDVLTREALAATVS